MNLLTINNVSKRFGQLPVLDELSLEVDEGSVFGFIGKNGSGKTTTMRIIVGLLKADLGEVYIKGKKVDFGQTATNHMIGYLPDVPEFYGFMNALEYLRFCGKIKGMNPADIKLKTSELLAVVGLEESAKRRIKGYSRGMKQRLGIAQALMHNPALLICDEPTSALDPQGRSEILNILSQVRERTTVLFSTHILADVERICDTVGMLEGGKIVFGGKLDEIKGRQRKDRLVVQLEDLGVGALETLLLELRALPYVQRCFRAGAEFTIDVDSVSEDGQQLLRELVARELTVLGFCVQEPSLENLYLDVIK
ncbi:MAG: ABC transporter ATP-binding protein [Coriobacteriales bacterium]|jgi:ABC-2 type transport system ATP-binding protein|nr:ABC transporter ATP-binding protein [Coriobacteriales bacterium]